MPGDVPIAFIYQSIHLSNEPGWFRGNLPVQEKLAFIMKIPTESLTYLTSFVRFSHGNHTELAEQVWFKKHVEEMESRWNYVKTIPTTTSLKKI